MDLAKRVNAGFDATAPRGGTYEVKGRHAIGRNRARRISGTGHPNSLPFDLLVAVLFREDLTVYRACRATRDVVAQVAKPDGRGWTLTLTDRLLNGPDFEDVTEQIRRVEPR